MNRHIEVFLKNKDHFKLVPNLKGLRINVSVSVKPAPVPIHTNGGTAEPFCP